jgi:hypothetical protein
MLFKSTNKGIDLTNAIIYNKANSIQIIKIKTTK